MTSDIDMQSGNSCDRWLGPFSVSNLPEYLTGGHAGDYGRNPGGFTDDLTTFACYHEVELIHACCAMPSNSSQVHAQSLLAIRRYQEVVMAAIATHRVHWLVQINDFWNDGRCDLPDRIDDFWMVMILWLWSTTTSKCGLSMVVNNLVDHDSWVEDLDDFTLG